MRRALRRVILGLLIFAVLLVGLTLWRSAHWIDMAEQYAETEPDTAIIYYRRAIQWYVPANPYVHKSIEALLEIAKEAQQANNTTRALEAYRSIRRGIMGIRGLYVPFEHVLENVNRKIATLMSQLKIPSDGSADERQKHFHRYLSQLQRDNAPNPWFSLVAVVAFIGWLMTCFAFIQFGFDESGKIVAKRALPLGGVGGVLLIVWILGLLHA